MIPITHIHTGARTMDIRTAGTSCIGIMDTRVTTNTIGASGIVCAIRDIGMPKRGRWHGVPTKWHKT